MAGVSSVLLIVSVIGKQLLSPQQQKHSNDFLCTPVGVFTPTIYWLVAGGFSYNCSLCYQYPNGTAPNVPLACSGCSYQHIDFDHNPIYLDRARLLLSIPPPPTLICTYLLIAISRPLMYICAAILPFWCVVVTPPQLSSASSSSSDHSSLFFVYLLWYC